MKRKKKSVFVVHLNYLYFLSDITLVDTKMCEYSPAVVRGEITWAIYCCPDLYKTKYVSNYVLCWPTASIFKYLCGMGVFV